MSRALRVRRLIAAPAGRAGTRPAYRVAQTAAAPFSSGTAMGRPRDKGERHNTIVPFLEVLYVRRWCITPTRHASPHLVTPAKAGVW